MSVTIKPPKETEVPESWQTMNTSSSKAPDVLGSNVLSVALIGPAEARRRSIATALASLQGSATREFTAYPDLDDVPRLLETDYDVIIVELDSNPEYALELIETICGASPVTVMVYSEQVYPEMLVRCMRAGAREFLSHPVTSTTIAEAMVRASVRRPAGRAPKKTAGKLLVFVGAKGGSGVTTIASNFAVALAQDSGRSTALVDLNLPFGNAALDLGLTGAYSTATALMNANRLDSNYLSTLLLKHSSGLSVLAAPDRYAPVHPTQEAIERLLAVTRQDFDYVVVDAGSRFDSASKALFEGGSTVYLVLQVGISELRNANRLISEVFRKDGVHLEIVLNRFASRSLSIDEASINKALTMPANWKVPGDFAAVRSAQNTATPLAMEDNAVSRVIKQMARAVYGPPEPQEKKKKFTLFG
ncbi:MAG TPA: AAA family ATPase [Acidobacteriaceae bacterium]|nr:AAA family ATPase [Acidobacteriaceae bacterium]